MVVRKNFFYFHTKNTTFGGLLKNSELSTFIFN